MSNEPTTTEDMALSLVPFYMDGGKQARYLSYLVASFSITESCKLAKVHLGSVKRWRREDPKFKVLEDKAVGELREQLSKNIIDMEFTRNFRLILAKDFAILFKDAQDVVLTEKEQQYLLLIRKFYTPQQFAMVKQIVGGDGPTGEAFDFTKVVLEMRLTKEVKHGVSQV